MSIYEEEPHEAEHVHILHRLIPVLLPAYNVNDNFCMCDLQQTYGVLLAIVPNNLLVPFLSLLVHFQAWVLVVRIANLHLLVLLLVLLQS